MALSKDKEVAARQRIERRIANKVVDVLLAAGFSILIDNGGDDAELDFTTNRRAIREHMFLTDEEYIRVWKDTTRGWVRFVYGNDGWDVINDSTVNLEPWIGEGTEVQKLIDRESDRWEARAK